MQRLQIERKKERLEKRIKYVEAELRSFRASRKDIHKTHSKGIQVFFQKTRWWQTEKIEKEVLS